MVVDALVAEGCIVLGWVVASETWFVLRAGVDVVIVMGVVVVCGLCVWWMGGMVAECTPGRMPSHAETRCGVLFGCGVGSSGCFGCCVCFLVWCLAVSILMCLLACCVRVCL